MGPHKASLGNPAAKGDGGLALLLLTSPPEVARLSTQVCSADGILVTGSLPDSPVP